MKNLVVGLLVCLGSRFAAAEPYFHAGFDTVYVGDAFALTPRAGFSEMPEIDTPVLEHSAADGYLLIPGVNWNLLNLGIGEAPDFSRGEIAFGPSIDLGTPLDALLLKAVKALPQGGNPAAYAFLKSVLSHDIVALAVLPQWTVVAERDAAGKRIFLGLPQVAVNLRVFFGGSK